jgi:hypothetical protein
MKRSLLSLFLGCIVVLSLAVTLMAAETPRSSSVLKYVVVDAILPIMSKPGGSYKVDKDGYIEGQNIEGVVVYGNHIRAKSASQKQFRNSWVEATNPEDGSVLGYVPLFGLEPLVVDDGGALKEYLVAKDSPLLTLQPGRTEKKYLLSTQGYELLRGEVVTAYGELEAAGAKWLMLGFGTSTESGGDGGSGMRFAWIRAEDVKPLSDYQADNSWTDTALLPQKIRNTRYQDHNNEASQASFLPVNDAMRKGITRYGFWMDSTPVLLERVRVDDMADVYADTRDYAVDFVTTDMFLHAYHLIFDRMLQKLETTYLAPVLGKLMTRTIAELEKSHGIIGPKGEEAYQRSIDMFHVTLALLENGKVKLSERASGEVQKIKAATGTGKSSITGIDTDYTQYKPRGHYTLTPELEKYFRAMSFLGDCGMKLFKDGEPQIEQIRTAALITIVMGSLGADWKNFEAPINFLVGKSDDIGPGTLSGLASYPAGYGDLQDNAKLARLADEIKSIIQPSRVGVAGSGHEFRISGKKFTFDAYTFTNLTDPEVKGRFLPEGTDVTAILGSEAATEASAHNDHFASYSDNLKRLRSEARDYIARDDTVYTTWLGILRDSFKNSRSKQFFYNSPVWGWKKLLTASASWAELKHDTILYAEQSGAEMGGGGEWFAGKFAPPAPRGYVDPDPQTFDAIAKAIERTEKFASDFSLEEDGGAYREKLRKLRELCVTARGIAQREVADSAVSAGDYLEIKNLARAFNATLLLPEDMTEPVGENVGEQLKMALIADVATDSATGETILLAATGTPRAIYVFVNDKSGGPRITRGYVYSYYEFVASSEQRMTDGEWKKIVYDPSRAEELHRLQPSWYGRLETK